MSADLTSVIVPAHNHAHFLPVCFASLVTQTSPVEIILVDDGSTDLTAEMFGELKGTGCFGTSHVFHYIRQDHIGPAAARNRGLEQATGEFVMFLDADDTIEKTKIERQLRELEASPEADWCLCDVQIKDAALGRTVLASERYDYANKLISGWIYPLLRNANFIPIMSPLVRRSVIEEHQIRFDERLVPEDYHFWCKLAKVARVRYVREILATYNKSKIGRSRTPPVWRQHNPSFTAPLRLNLGCGTQGKESWHPLPGFIDLDKSFGWTYESGLGDFAEDTVSGISISHSLMFVELKHWPFIFAEFMRVLRPGGVIRITEDETYDTRSKCFGGWKGSEPFVTRTGIDQMYLALVMAGFDACEMPADASRYEDGSLIQRFHGGPPDVFFIEGVKRA